MNIAVIHLRHRGTGGTERYLQQVAGHLAAHGHAVTIICRSHEAPPHPAVRFVVLRRLALGGAWRLWAFARAVERHVRAADYDVVYALGRTWSHDVIRLGGGLQQTYLESAYADTSGWWPGGPGPQERMALAIERRALAPGAYARVVTNARLVRDDVMRRYAVPPERVTVIYNGVDLQRFDRTQSLAAAARLRSACGMAPDDLVVLFLGTGYRRKGLDRVLQAFPQLLRHERSARLMVVGYDSTQASFARTADRLGVASRVHFLGGRRDAEACFAAADVYVLPTRYDPFANTSLEALASGLPVVTTVGNGASEILTPGVDGSVLAAAAPPAALVDALLYWSDRAQLRRGALAARALAERYSEQRTVEASRVLLEDVGKSR